MEMIRTIKSPAISVLLRMPAKRLPVLNFFIVWPPPGPTALRFPCHVKKAGNADPTEKRLIRHVEKTLMLCQRMWAEHEPGLFALEDTVDKRFDGCLEQG